MVGDASCLRPLFLSVFVFSKSDPVAVIPIATTDCKNVVETPAVPSNAMHKAMEMGISSEKGRRTRIFCVCFGKSRFFQMLTCAKQESSTVPSFGTWQRYPPFRMTHRFLQGREPDAEQSTPPLLFNEEEHRA